MTWRTARLGIGLVVLALAAASCKVEQAREPEPTWGGLTRDAWIRIGELVEAEFGTGAQPSDRSAPTDQGVTTTTAAAPSTTTTAAAPSTTTTAAAPSTTTTAAAPSTTTTVAVPVVEHPVADGVVQFAASFESESDFVDRFVTHAGNYVDWDLHRTGWLLENQPWVSTPATFEGDHNRECQGPDTSRTIHVADIEEFFWHCNPGGDPAKGHVMTAFVSSGYSIISFSPDQTIHDLTQVCWDVNATDMGGGKWTNMIVVPESLYQQFAPRMDYVTAGFNQDNAPGDFNIQAHDHPGQVIFGLKDFRGTLQMFENDDQFWSSGNIAFVTTDKKQRFTKCVTQTSPGILTITAERPGGSMSHYEVAGSLPAGPVRVIFQDDQYNAPKRTGYNPDKVTWHWDNIKITGTS